MRRHLLFIIFASIVAVILSLSILYISYTGVKDLKGFIRTLRPKSVAIIYLSGVIAYRESYTLPVVEFITPKTVDELLQDALQENAGAIVMVIDSPGGDPSACYEIYHIIQRFREAHEIPIVAYIPSMACSGGYYISLAADRIVANPNALVGSVGAVSMVFSYHELLDKIGIEVEIIKSGRYKDLGSPAKELSREDLKVMKRLVSGIYEHFKQVLLMSRGDKIKKENMTDILNAMVYLGDEALEVGLVDEIGTLERAKVVAQELAGLPESAPVVELKPRARPSWPFIASWPILLERLLGTTIPLSPLKAFKLLYAPS